MEAMNLLILANEVVKVEISNLPGFDWLTFSTTIIATVIGAGLAFFSNNFIQKKSLKNKIQIDININLLNELQKSFNRFFEAKQQIGECFTEYMTGDYEEISNKIRIINYSLLNECLRLKSNLLVYKNDDNIVDSINLVSNHTVSYVEFIFSKVKDVANGASIESILEEYHKYNIDEKISFELVELMKIMKKELYSLLKLKKI
ncbi:MAG: hypothetical protein ACK5L6_03890 [Anaerorhabdus sp.]|uniref:hypothetical protein n=1 Tax=Anaerorhabdus sp. TaxID=1872524 RepID=UPI003A852DD7